MSTPSTGSGPAATSASADPPTDHPTDRTSSQSAGQAALLRQVASSSAVVGLLAYRRRDLGA